MFKFGQDFLLVKTIYILISVSLLYNLISYFRKNAANDTIFHTGVEISEALEVIVNSQNAITKENLTESFVSVSISKIFLLLRSLLLRKI